MYHKLRHVRNDTLAVILLQCEWRMNNWAPRSGPVRETG
jgi:hypothetical protein